jgi:hypothetical protein
MAKSFKDLGIAPIEKRFSGEKIKMKKVLNKSITVNAYKIEPSKFEGNRLCLQVTIEQIQNIIFTGSVGLIEQIQKVSKEDFPFTTIIIEENDCFMFS